MAALQVMVRLLKATGFLLLMGVLLPAMVVLVL